jgi:hypothetical protein
MTSTTRNFPASAWNGSYGRSRSGWIVGPRAGRQSPREQRYDDEAGHGRPREGHSLAGGFNPPQADLFSHNAVLINASCERIWGHIVDATKWPHTWYLKPQGDACLVVTDEVGKGKDAAHLRETDESLMHRGHDLWLATLKCVSEAK